MRFYLLIVAHLITFHCLASKQVKKVKSPNWVVPIAIANDSIVPDVGSSQYLLVDYQTNLIDEVEFEHYAIKILSADGIDDHADLDMSFDPTYSTLSIHQVNLIRDGVVIDKLRSSEIKTIQRESNKDRSMYDGTLTAIIHLNDVRVGDIIEYAYSKKGFNPINKGNFSSSFYQQYTIPVNRLYNSLICPNAEYLEFQYKNDADRPKIESLGSGIKYIWDMSAFEKVNYDNNVPAWYNEQKVVYFTTYKSWSEVAQWARGLYTYEATNVNSILSDFDRKLPKKELVRQIARYVQDDIRYLGLESGISAYKPHKPAEVYKQKYGDCKDKSLLLVAMLRQIDVDAQPLLVNTKLKDALNDRLPAHNVFDHCVVRFGMDGDVFYIDPTMTGQGGQLNDIQFPNYGVGLIVDEDVTKLTELPMKFSATIDIDEKFVLDEIGGAATLTVKTTYTGYKADNIRRYFSTEAMDNIKKNYLNFYSNLYSEIESAEDISFQDSLKDSTNSVLIVEKYNITELWNKDDTSNIYFETNPLVLRSLIDYTSSAKRSMPYFLGSPYKFTQSTIILFPEPWSIDAHDIEIKDDAFIYRSTSKLDGHVVTLNHEYELKQEYIDAADVPNFTSKTDKIINDLTFYASYDHLAANGSGISYFALFVALLSLVIGIYAAVKLYFKYDPAPAKDAANMSIGGWMILPAIGLVLSPILTLPEIISEDFFGQANWDAFKLIYPDTTYLLWTLVSFELVYNILITIFNVLLIVLFFQRRTSLPKLISIYFLASFIFLLADSVFAAQLLVVGEELPDYSTLWSDAGRSFIAALIWVPYFLTSERVKNTFCVQRRESTTDEMFIES